MTARILPVEEWARLAGTEAETVWPHLDPLTAFVVVVEDAGAIVGCHVLMRVWHVECLWIADAHRGKGSVARRLWSAVRRTAQAMGARTVWTAAMDDRVRGLLAHVGALQMPGDHYVIPLTEN